ncbi:MAG: hypothetical protein KDD83_27290, partial [Caldilineaceae bacterium]|nr:hypothetical protein [Caldilineaceae bacterium]
KRGQILESLRNAAQITDAVTIAVGKAAWVNLIRNAFLPPTFLHAESSTYESVMRPTNSICQRSISATAPTIFDRRVADADTKSMGY